MDLMNTRGDSSRGEETPQLVFLWRNPLLSSSRLLTVDDIEEREEKSYSVSGKRKAPYFSFRTQKKIKSQTYFKNNSQKILKQSKFHIISTVNISFDYY